MIVRYSTMTQNQPQVPPKPKKGKKRWLTPARATIIAAFVAVGGGVAGAYIAPQNKPTTVPAPSASPTPLGAAILTIDEPTTGDINYQDSYSGKALNLRPGQLVWTFNQTVSGGKVSDKVYPDTGPCTVDYSRQEWACTGADEVYVGSKPPDHNTYMVCAAIIDAQTAFAIVDDLRSGKKDFSMPLSSLPSIQDGGPSCMSVHRL